MTDIIIYHELRSFNSGMCVTAGYQGSVWNSQASLQ